MPSIEAQLDHVVLLLPYKDITDPPSWITDHFTLSPGGVHADGKTENKLILFADGSYLELIAFIQDDPEKRRGHWWDKKGSYGVIDFAFRTQDESFGELDGIRDRLSKTDTGISFTDPVPGGRRTPDGVELQWRVTFPTGTERGSAPFWCHDVTPRARRVPLSDSSTKHPSGVLGMGGLKLHALETSRLSAAMAAILDLDLNSEQRYQLGVVQDVAGADKPSIRIETAAPGEKEELALSLVLQSTQDLAPIHHKIADGTVDMVFEKPSQ